MVWQDMLKGDEKGRHCVSLEAGSESGKLRLGRMTPLPHFAWEYTGQASPPDTPESRKTGGR